MAVAWGCRLHWYWLSRFERNVTSFLIIVFVLIVSSTSFFSFPFSSSRNAARITIWLARSKKAWNSRYMYEVFKFFVQNQCSKMLTFQTFRKNLNRPKKQFHNLSAIKVHIFWEGHKILRNLHRRFDCYYMGQIYGGDFAKNLWPSQNIWTLQNIKDLIAMLFADLKF